MVAIVQSSLRSNWGYRIKKALYLLYHWSKFFFELWEIYLKFVGHVTSQLSDQEHSRGSHMTYLSSRECQQLSQGSFNHPSKNEHV